jgi:geranylgeranyl diphosphate synthase, type I
MERFRGRLDADAAAFVASKRAVAAAAFGARPPQAAGGSEPADRPAPATAGDQDLRPAAGAVCARVPARQAAAAGLAALPPLVALVDGVSSLMVQGGKRLRPALVHYTYRACGGRSDDRVLPLALATELLHTYLLIHDDIMDHAGLRRGQPAAHVRFRDLHRASGLRGDAEDFGRSVAILLGDLAHTWAVELFSSALAGAGGEPAPAAPLSRRGLAELNRCFAAMCEEVIGGQYLEYLLAHRGISVQEVGDEPDVAASAAREAELLHVLRLKSGRYTAERPIQLGALLAGAPPEVCAELSRYGTAVGEAFQLQDDLLGVFGDPAMMGKPVGDDLREGKFTLLIHHALAHGAPGDRSLIAAALGNPGLTAAEVAGVQLALERSGARRAVTEMIAERLAAARAALDALAVLAPQLFGLPGDGPREHTAEHAAAGAEHAAEHPTEHGIHPPAGPADSTAPASGEREGPRFLRGLLDWLWERER